jgi:ComF family protein
MSKLKLLYKGFISLLYPSICYLCKTTIQNEQQIICLSCYYHLPKSSVRSYKNNSITKKFYDIYQIENFISLYKYEKNNSVQKLIYLLKYNNKKEVGIFFGIQISEFLRYHDINHSFDIIIPLPIHYKKKKIRGYNQAEIIAQELSKQIGVPMKKIIRKIKSTESQTNKTIYRRWQNQEEIFELDTSQNLNNKHIVIIDDVITSGATMYNCLRIFKHIKIKITIICIAQA